MGAWKTVRQLKCLLNKCEDQSSDLQKTTQTEEDTWKAKLRRQREGIPRASWLTGQALSVSSGFD